MRLQQVRDIQTSERVLISALKTDVVPLNSNCRSEAPRARPDRFKRSCGPMIDMFLGSTQPALKAAAILAEVVEDASKTALFLCSE
jgi:hypothetical protein